MQNYYVLQSIKRIKAADLNSLIKAPSPLKSNQELPNHDNDHNQVGNSYFYNDNEIYEEIEVAAKDNTDIEIHEVDDIHEEQEVESIVEEVDESDTESDNRTLVQETNAVVTQVRYSFYQ